MTDDRYAPQPLARWYMPASWLSLILMLLGCAAMVNHLETDPATLPLDQRALFEAEPAWVFAASAIGIVAGAAGAVLLLLRWRAAEMFMLLSLVLMAVWFAGMFATPAFRELLTTTQIAIAIVVVAIVWTIFWFARHSRQRGWLR